nr:Hypothetical protein CDS [Astacus astacus]
MATTSNPVSSDASRCHPAACIDSYSYEPQFVAIAERLAEHERVDGPAYNLSGTVGCLPTDVTQYVRQLAGRPPVPPLHPARDFPFCSENGFRELPPVPPYRGKIEVEGTAEGEESVYDSMSTPYWSPQRTFGNARANSRLTTDLARGLGDHLRTEGEETIRHEVNTRLSLGAAYVYSAGTPEGLRTRLDGYSKTSASIQGAVKKYLGLDLRAAVRLVMRKRLTSRPSFSKYTRADDVLTSITTNPTSGAGPLYGPDAKRDCMGKIRDAMIALEAKFSDGTITTFLESNPIWWASECKNKTDLYETEKLRKKTRPYYHFNAHWQFLYSFLCQPYCAGMKVATNDGDASSWNCYGHRWTNDGARKLIRRVALARKEPWVGLYGDDSLYSFPTLRKQGGKEESGVLIYGPDVKQMDSTVAHAVIETVIDEIYTAYIKQHGETPFIRYVCNMWKQDATRPRFAVHGSKTYQLKGDTGLATGVVGTTLFDTVQAAIAAEIAFAIWRQESHTPEASVNKAYAACGMTIKEGTDVTQFVPFSFFNHESVEKRRARLVATGSHETVLSVPFLGMQISYAHVGPETWGYIPSLTQEGLWRSLLNPDMLQTGYAGTRRRFDALRGLLLCTGGIHALDWDAIMYAINRMPSEVVAAVVQLGEGRGESPVHLGMEDVRWEDSSGVPSPRWVMQLFTSESVPTSDWRPLLACKDSPYVAPVRATTVSQPLQVWTEMFLPTEVVDPESSLLSNLPPMAPKPRPSEIGDADPTAEFMRNITRLNRGPPWDLSKTASHLSVPPRILLMHALEMGTCFYSSLLCAPGYPGAERLVTDEFRTRYPTYRKLYEARARSDETPPEVTPSRGPPPRPSARIETGGSAHAWVIIEAETAQGADLLSRPESLPLKWETLQLYKTGNGKLDLRSIWKMLLNASQIVPTHFLKPEYAESGVRNTLVTTFGDFVAETRGRSRADAEFTLFAALTKHFHKHFLNFDDIQRARQHAKNRKKKSKTPSQDAPREAVRGEGLQPCGGPERSQGSTTGVVPQSCGPLWHSPRTDVPNVRQVRGSGSEGGLLPVCGLQQLGGKSRSCVSIAGGPDPSGFRTEHGVPGEKLKGGALPCEEQVTVERAQASDPKQPRGVQPRGGSNRDPREFGDRLLRESRCGHPRDNDCHTSVQVLEPPATSGPANQHGEPVLSTGPSRLESLPRVGRPRCIRRPELCRHSPVPVGACALAVDRPDSTSELQGWNQCVQELGCDVLLHDRRRQHVRASQGNVLPKPRCPTPVLAARPNGQADPDGVLGKVPLDPVLLDVHPPARPRVSDCPPSRESIRATRDSGGVSRTTAEKGTGPGPDGEERHNQFGPDCPTCVRFHRHVCQSKTAGIYRKIDLGPGKTAGLHGGRGETAKHSGSFLRGARGPDEPDSFARLFLECGTGRSTSPCLHCRRSFEKRTSADVLCRSCLGRSPPTHVPHRRHSRSPSPTRVQRGSRHRPPPDGSRVQRGPRDEGPRVNAHVLRERRERRAGPSGGPDRRRPTSWGDSTGSPDRHGGRKRKGGNRRRKSGRTQLGPRAGSPPSHSGGPCPGRRERLETLV